MFLDVGESDELAGVGFSFEGLESDLETPSCEEQDDMSMGTWLCFRVVVNVLCVRTGHIVYQSDEH